MPHIAIVGMSGSGKTYLARQLVIAASRKRRCLVLDPKGTRWQGASFVTTDPDKLLRVAKLNKDCLLVIDEGGAGLNRHNVAHDWFSTMSREWGHNCIFITQRAKQVNPNIRENCYKVALFKCSRKAAEDWAEEFANEELLKATSLEQYSFFWCDKFKGCIKTRLS